MRRQEDRKWAALDAVSPSRYFAAEASPSQEKELLRYNRRICAKDRGGCGRVLPRDRYFLCHTCRHQSLLVGSVEGYEYGALTTREG